jgi:hypothetical protein
LAQPINKHKKVCTYCNKQFETYYIVQRFCNEKCSYKYGRQKLLKNKLENPQKYKMRDKQYGINRKLSNYKNGKNVLEFMNYNCVMCNNKFKPNHSKAKYCSDNCRRAAERYRILNRKKIPSEKKKVNKMWNEWRKKNKKYIGQKLKNNPQAYIKHCCAVRIKGLLNSKNTTKNKKTLELIGCTKKELIQHLESKFQKGMNWKNHGFYGWHIDHIKPCALFDLTKEEEQLKCFNYKNLQPLWGIDNIKKGKKYNEAEI